MIKNRIREFQKLMRKKGIHAYIIPTDDFHQSEYVQNYFNEREFMSGFTGSAGTLVITLSGAYLWTDGRYFLQAEEQLADTGITLMKQGMPDVPTINEFLWKNLRDGETLGFFGKTMDAKSALRLKKKLSSKNIELYTTEDLVDQLWTDRPALTHEEAFALPASFTGEPFSSKLLRVRELVAKKGCNTFLLSKLDDIAWLFNLRGSDVHCNPVVLAYALILPNDVKLFIDINALNGDITRYLRENKVDIQPYDEIYFMLEDLVANKKVMLSKKDINYSLYNIAESVSAIVDETNPTTTLKAIKNEVELDNLKNCHIRDGIAMTRFLIWLSAQDVEQLTELDISKKLYEFRNEGDRFVDISFDTIAGYGPHGAIIHYEPTEESNARLEKRSFLLIDSGGQYLDGTTDITRTIALGPLTYEERVHYTTVLKSMISVARAIFIRGCSGENLDIIAREPFWEQGLDYNHGTGHGVGFFLNVHEGPQRLNYKIVKNNPVIEFKEGMTITDEPGIYVKDKHGIRIENVLVCKKMFDNEFGSFLGFDTLTVAPIDTTPVIKEMLDPKDIRWLNDYHKHVYTTLSPFLNEDEIQWLREATAKI